MKNPFEKRFAILIVWILQKICVTEILEKGKKGVGLDDFLLSVIIVDVTIISRPSICGITAQFIKCLIFTNFKDQMFLVLKI